MQARVIIARAPVSNYHHKRLGDYWPPDLNTITADIETQSVADKSGNILGCWDLDPWRGGTGHPLTWVERVSTGVAGSWTAHRLG
jgi:hypothetical protein